MERLLPEPGPIELREQLESFIPAELAGPERPYVFTNFAATVDGHATVEGRSGPIGSKTDSAMLLGLRTRADAILVGAGTLRTERYGRLIRDPEVRARRGALGLAADPIAVVVSSSLDLPWDAGLFSCGEGKVVVFTDGEGTAPDTPTELDLIRLEDELDLAAMLARLRRDHGIAGLLCEGGPHLHGQLLTAGLVDEIFLTLGPLLGGGDGPRIAEQLAGDPIPLRMRWLLREGDELFARYAVTG